MSGPYTDTDHDEGLCPNCGNTGIGMLGIHKWVDAGTGYNQQEAEYGSPCPTCGRQEEKNDRDSQG